MTSLRRVGAAIAATGILAALLPAGAGAAVQVGSSGWQWGNPLPQGNAIRALAFAGPKGYAAGDFGTLLTTNDAGETWSGLPSGTFSGLYEVQAVDADSMVAGGGCVARRSDDGGRTFARIAFTPVESSCKEPLVALAFPAEKTGYVLLADGTVLLTTDGGTEFAQKVAIPGTRSAPGGGTASPTDAFFLTPTVGYVSSSDGKIFRTVDAGNTWSLVNDTQRAVRSIWFTDAATGYAVGRDSLFLKTTDGGASWTPRDIGSPQQLTSVRCATPDLCVATTEKGDVLVRTADGGTTFAFPALSSDPLHAAAFASPTRLVAGGDRGSTVVSDDAGLTSRAIGGRLSGDFRRIRAGLVAGTAFAPGTNGALARTVDGGRTWTRANVSTSEDVLDVAFPTADIGYALDVEGGLFRTSTGAASWRSLDKGTTAIPRAIHATAADTVLLVGPRGVRRSTDSGETFSQVRSSAVARTQLEGIDRAGSTLVAWGSQDLVRSSDSGKTWKAVRKPGKYVRRGKRSVNRLGIRKADFVTASSGFVLDSAGRVWRTRNGGKSWTELPGVGTNQGFGLAFSGAKDGYLVVPLVSDEDRQVDGLLRTNDGGSTWHPQFVVAESLPEFGIAAPGGGPDYLLGGASALLFSTTGGDQGTASTLTITTSKRRLKGSGRIRVTGRLQPATGSETITVKRRSPGATGWTSQSVKVAGNGAFTTSWRVTKGTTTFVAQWAGDFRSRGDGSPTLAVKVGR